MLSSKYNLLYPLGGTYRITSYCLHTGSFLPTVIPFLLIRAFQEYKNLTATLENNRNYLSDSYGDFLYNNDEYLWTPVRTYYKEKTLVIINFTFFIFIFLQHYLFQSILLILLSQSLIYFNSVQLVSIMDHFGYATRPLVEFNLSIYTDRASFLGLVEPYERKEEISYYFGSRPHQSRLDLRTRGFRLLWT